MLGSLGLSFPSLPSLPSLPSAPQLSWAGRFGCFSCRCLRPSCFSCLMHQGLHQILLLPLQDLSLQYPLTSMCKIFDQDGSEVFQMFQSFICDPCTARPHPPLRTPPPAADHPDPPSCHCGPARAPRSLARAPGLAAAPRVPGWWCHGALPHPGSWKASEKKKKSTVEKWWK